MLCIKKDRHKPPLNLVFFKILLKLFWAVMLLLVSSKSLHAQYNIDSIKALSYEEFIKYFRKSQVDSVKDLIYANIFLEKAKKDRDTLKMANAYLQLSNVYPYQLGLKYADSSIIVTKNINGNKNYPALAYLYKAMLYYNMDESQKAIDEYIIAQEWANKNKNIDFLATIKANIGAIKLNLGEKEEALMIFKDYVSFVAKSETLGPDKNIMLVQGLFSLAVTYTHIKEYDSAIVEIKKGVKIALDENYTDIYANFLSLYGVNFYHKKDYRGAIDSIQKAIKVYDLKNNIAFASLYLGKSNLALGDTAIALKHFLEVDSFLCNNSIVTQVLLEAYSPVIEYYQKRKDYVQQLHYTNQLIKFDSIFDAKKSVVSKDISTKYDIPLLVASKEKLIDKLNKDKNLSTRNIYLLLAFLILLIAAVTYFIIRNRRYKKRFDKLLSQLNDKETDKDIEDKKQVIEETLTENTPAALDSELVNSILNKLDKFEESKRFTNNSYTLGKLAKELKTNNTYLSKIINDHKRQSFSNYLKDLRIDFAISQLKNDAKFRSYTIQAIAEEVGFNKAQSFSVAFHKRTGLYPSYFTKQLEKQKIGTE